MLNWLRRILNKPGGTEHQPDDRALALEREIQALRLDLEERKQMIANLKNELERQRSDESARINEIVQSQIEFLMLDAASAVAQLATQSHLLEVDQKPMQAKDVMSVARRLIRAFEDHGLSVEGRPGEVVSFDPNRHEPLSGGASITPGQQVIIRIAGVAYRRRVLRKVGVEINSSDSKQKDG